MDRLPAFPRGLRNRASRPSVSSRITGPGPRCPPCPAGAGSPGSGRAALRMDMNHTVPETRGSSMPGSIRTFVAADLPDGVRAALAGAPASASLPAAASVKVDAAREPAPDAAVPRRYPGGAARPCFPRPRRDRRRHPFFRARAGSGRSVSRRPARPRPLDRSRRCGPEAAKAAEPGRSRSPRPRVEAGRQAVCAAPDARPPAPTGAAVRGRLDRAGSPLPLRSQRGRADAQHPETGRRRVRRSAPRLAGRLSRQTLAIRLLPRGPESWRPISGGTTPRVQSQAIRR